MRLKIESRPITQRASEQESEKVRDQCARVVISFADLPGQCAGTPYSLTLEISSSISSTVDAGHFPLCPTSTSTHQQKKAEKRNSWLSPLMMHPFRWWRQIERAKAKKECGILNSNKDVKIFAFVSVEVCSAASSFAYLEDWECKRHKKKLAVEKTVHQSKPSPAQQASKQDRNRSSSSSRMCLLCPFGQRWKCCKSDAKDA